MNVLFMYQWGKMSADVTKSDLLLKKSHRSIDQLINELKKTKEPRSVLGKKGEKISLNCVQY